MVFLAPAPSVLDFDGGIQFVYLRPEILSQLWPLGLHCGSQKAILHRKEFIVESNTFDLQERTRLREKREHSQLESMGCVRSRGERP